MKTALTSVGAFCIFGLGSIDYAHALNAAGGEFEPPLLRLVLGFSLCAMLALLAALAIKHAMSKGMKLPRIGASGFLNAPKRAVRVRESHRISPTAEVCLVSWGEREFLIVVANGAITTLDSRPVQLDPP